EGVAGERFISVEIGLGRPIDLGLAVDDPPKQVGFEADDRITAANGAAFHRFEEEGITAPGGELEIGPNRGFQIGDDAPIENLPFAGIVTLCKSAELG